MKFKYRAIARDGRETTGISEAADRLGLAREFRVRDLILVSAVPVGTETAPALGNLFDLFSWVRAKDKLVFASSLAAMLGAGLSLSRALGVMERQSRGRFQRVLIEIATAVNQGTSLSQALAGFPRIFPPVFVAMTAAGEESGNLPQSLELVHQQLQRNYDLRRKVRGAMIYPAIILTLIIVIGILMMMFVVPTISQLFAEFDAELPLSTRVIIGISNFIVNRTLVFFLLLFALIALIVWFWKSDFGRRLTIKIFLRLPIFGTLMKNFNAAVLMRTLSSLIAAGVSMVGAIEITVRVIQNPFYRELLAGATTGVQKGRPFSETFRRHEDLFPVLVGELTEVGEESGNLSKMLLRGAVFFEEEVEQTTKNLSTVIEPALMVMIGVAVGFFAVAVIGPIYSLSDVF